MEELAESKYSSTKYACPYCRHAKSWRVRRSSRKCKSCRREWSPPRDVVPGLRATEKDWQQFLLCFLRYKTAKGIGLHCAFSHPKILAMCKRVREAMSGDLPETSSGIVEADETYIAGTWYNKSWDVRKHGTKRGRGTTKQPVFGLSDRKRKQVRAWLVADVRKRTLMPIMKKHITLAVPFTLMRTSCIKRR
jgi:transposase-like protein